MFYLQHRAQIDTSHSGEIGLLARDLNTMLESIPYRNAQLEFVYLREICVSKFL
jgi:hypothetical protein